VTTTDPALAAGDLHVIEVAVTTATLVAATDPNFTVAPEMKPVPVMVTGVPPAIGPAVWLIDMMVGIAL
jgi:hypothetical protein